MQDERSQETGVAKIEKATPQNICEVARSADAFRVTTAPETFPSK